MGTTVSEIRVLAIETSKTCTAYLLAVDSLAVARLVFEHPHDLEFRLVQTQPLGWLRAARNLLTHDVREISRTTTNCTAAYPKMVNTISR